SLTVSAAEGVLANDSADNNAPLTATLETPPGLGTVTLHPDGSFAYVSNVVTSLTPDKFTYSVTDGISTSDADVIINLPLPVGAPPPGTCGPNDLLACIGGSHPDTSLEILWRWL